MDDKAPANARAEQVIRHLKMAFDDAHKDAVSLVDTTTIVVRQLLSCQLALGVGPVEGGAIAAMATAAAANAGEALKNLADAHREATRIAETMGLMPVTPMGGTGSGK